jgi:hypothetical protein
MDTERGFYLLQYNAVHSGGSQPTFWKNISPPSCCLLHAGFLFGLVFNLKMEAICSFEALVDIQLTTRRCIPEGRTLHSHPCENVRSDMDAELREMMPPTEKDRERTWV